MPLGPLHFHLYPNLANLKSSHSQSTLCFPNKFSNFILAFLGSHFLQMVEQKTHFPSMPNTSPLKGQGKTNLHSIKRGLTTRAITFKATKPIKVGNSQWHTHRDKIIKPLMTLHGSNPNPTHIEHHVRLDKSESECAHSSRIPTVE